jgi:MSHA pilin protein MshD
MRAPKQLGGTGVTLVELLIAIVVVGIAASGVLLVMSYTTGHSADPMIQHQAVAIAEAYLEEALLQPYDDPDGVAVVEADRSLFDDLDDYNFVEVGARQQSSPAVLIPGLEAYTVTVAVTAEVLNSVAAKRITVTVTNPGGVGLTLTGYRTDY